MVLLLTMGTASASAHAVPSLVNPGFETDGAPVQSPTGWTTSGMKTADFTEAGGPTSENQALFDFNNRPTPVMIDFRP
jgi:arabinogalactan endo-1,4-beta-galactosidase